MVARRARRPDPFRFPVLEKWVAQVVYALDQDAEVERALLALAKATDIPHSLIEQRLSMAAGRPVKMLTPMLFVEPEHRIFEPIDVEEEEPEQVFSVVSFASIKDNEPAPQQLTWRELCVLLSTPAVAESKDAVMLWSPVTYKADTRRGAKNVEKVNLIVLDFDDGAHWRDVLPRWEGCAAFVHTSWSHTREHPKWRLVVPLAEPVSSDLWPQVWRWADKRSGGSDPACKDPCRVFYVPACRDLELFERIEVQGEPVTVPAVHLKPVPAVSPWLKRGQQRRLKDARAEGKRSDVYKLDPGAREALGLRMGGTVQGGHVKGVKCPACGRASLRWWVAIGSELQAYCAHKKSCGHRAWLDEVEG